MCLNVSAEKSLSHIYMYIQTPETHTLLVLLHFWSRIQPSYRARFVMTHLQTVEICWIFVKIVFISRQTKCSALLASFSSYTTEEQELTAVCGNYLGPFLPRGFTVHAAQQCILRVIPERLPPGRVRVQSALTGTPGCVCVVLDSLWQMSSLWLPQAVRINIAVDKKSPYPVSAGRFH